MREPGQKPALSSVLFQGLRSHRHLLSLMLSELDQLATLNEQYGYQSGDRALQLVASTLERIRGALSSK